MTDKEALQAIARKETLPQPIVKRLWKAGLIEVTDITHLQSTEREYLPTFITAKGKKLMEID